VRRGVRLAPVEGQTRTAPGGQDEGTAALNREYFAADLHADAVAELDTFHNIRAAITEEVEGIDRVLDVGNGGVFEYDTERVGSIVAVDLFLDQLPLDRFPPNVTARRGNALALTEPEGSFDAVLHSFLYHHLVGPTADDLAANVRRAIAEAKRMLKPGGRLLVGESCVPRWFYGVERALYRPLWWLAKTPVLGGHPAAMQLHPGKLRELVAEQLEVERMDRIPHGRWVTQFGRKWPTALTPAQPWVLSARYPG
jgi:SAM-dependent methyltransferase